MRVSKLRFVFRYLITDLSELHAPKAKFAIDTIVQPTSTLESPPLSSVTNYFIKEATNVSHIFRTLTMPGHFNIAHKYMDMLTPRSIKLVYSVDNEMISDAIGSS